MHSAQQTQSLDDTLVPAVQDALSGYLTTRRSELTGLEPSFGPAVDALADFVLSGGKRIRPTFAWWGWRGAGGDADGPEARAVVHAISSLELIQACALVHDDIMDASAIRRGKPTVHVAFAELHRRNGWLGEPERFGTSAAILLGDLALAWADDMLSVSGLAPHRIAAANQAWQAMRSEMLAGQYLDVLTQATGDASADAALRIARLKTAAYTVECPLHMGAALAGADGATIDALRSFGTDIGVAFQLRDDVLGVFGDSAVTGKPAGDDLREGKRTLLVALGIERATAAQAAVINGALGNDELDDATVDDVRAILLDLDAVAAVEDRIATLTETALRSLRAADLAEPAATRLADLAVSATRRSS